MITDVHPVTALQRRLREDPATPLLTHLDAAAGSRIELSTATFANNVSKTAHLLADELLVERGDVVAIDLPAHWQSAVWTLAAWSVGAQPAWGRVPARVAITHDPAAVIDAEDVFLTALHPLGTPWQGPVPSPLVDWSVAMRTHPDTFTPTSLDDMDIEDEPALEGRRVLLVTEDAAAVGEAMGRVLASRASLVLVTSSAGDADARARTVDEGIDLHL